MVNVQLLDVEDLAGGWQCGLALPLAGAPGCSMNVVVKKQEPKQDQHVMRVTSTFTTQGVANSGKHGLV